MPALRYSLESFRVKFRETRVLLVEMIIDAYEIYTGVMSRFFITAAFTCQLISVDMLPL